MSTNFARKPVKSALQAGIQLNEREESKVTIIKHSPPRAACFGRLGGQGCAEKMPRSKMLMRRGRLQSERDSAGTRGKGLRVECNIGLGMSIMFYTPTGQVQCHKAVKLLTLPICVRQFGMKFLNCDFGFFSFVQLDACLKC